MKRSKEITLILIASASLAACGPQSQDTRREIYASREKCQEDWGSGENCEQQGSYYQGPHYYYRGGNLYFFRRGFDQAQPDNPAAKFSHLPPGKPSLNSAGSFTTSHISRGGFGRIGSFFRSGS
jgi:uncharacterized protein YgiB involved in biofilm formation